jgi:hypothetical protein
MLDQKYYSEYCACVRHRGVEAGSASSRAGTSNGLAVSHADERQLQADVVGFAGVEAPTIGGETGNWRGEPDRAVVAGGNPLDRLVVVERGDRRSTLVYGFQDEVPNSKSRRTPKREPVVST